MEESCGGSPQQSGQIHHSHNTWASGQWQPTWPVCLQTKHLSSLDKVQNNVQVLKWQHNFIATFLIYMFLLHIIQHIIYWIYTLDFIGHILVILREYL